MLSRDESIRLRNLRCQFWLGVDDPDVRIENEGEPFVFPLYSECSGYKFKTRVRAFPWDLIRPGCSLEFHILNKNADFIHDDADVDQPQHQLYATIMNSNGAKRDYLIQAADFSPFRKT
jgi:hypothetical protein